MNNFKSRLYKSIIVSLFSLSVAISVYANPMHDVAVIGNIEVARCLIKMRDKISLDINATREDGCTPLHVAVNHGHKNIVLELLQAKADITIADNRGFTALHSAVGMGYSDIASILLQAGADINVKTNRGSTVLSVAIGVPSNPDIIRELLKAGGMVKGSLSMELCKAAFEGDQSTLRSYLSTKPDLNIYSGPRNWTLLHWASVGNQPHVIRVLLNAGSNVNSKDMYGLTVLHLACLCGNEAVVKFLVCLPNINVNAKDWIDSTPLHLASMVGCKKIVQVLLKAGSKVNLKNKAGSAPLHEAVLTRKCDPEIVTQLLTAGAEVNISDELGLTPLYIATRRKDLKAVSILLDNGAKIDARTETEDTPLGMAIRQRQDMIIRFFLDHLRKRCQVLTFDKRVITDK